VPLQLDVLLLVSFLLVSFFNTEDGCHLPPKYRLTSSALHGVIFQRITLCNHHCENLKSYIMHLMDCTHLNVNNAEFFFVCFMMLLVARPCQMVGCYVVYKS
jgi:hypothetical protein